MRKGKRECGSTQKKKMTEKKPPVSGKRKGKPKRARVAFSFLGGGKNEKKNWFKEGIVGERGGEII